MTLRKDLKLASFDATGPECLSQLEGMLNVMDRLRIKLYPNEPERVMLPCEYFDLMGGSGSGGLIVLFLARLRMSVEEAIPELAHIVDKVYSDYRLTAEDQTSLLRISMEDLLTKRGVPIDFNLEAEEDDEKCGGFVLASPRIGLGDILCLRSYDVKRYPSSTITVVEAALATCAIHRLGSPNTVDKSQGYMGPGLEGSNPIRAVICEASLRYGGDSSIASLLSLGARTHEYAEGPILDQKSLPASLEVALAHNEEVAEQIHSLLDRTGCYYRFPSCQKTGGNDLSRADATMEKCVESLMAKDGAIALELHYWARMRDLSNEPPMAPHFVTREDPEHRLRTAIEQKHPGRKVIVVSGKAGCGKKQLVRRVVEDFNRNSRFRHIFWVNAISELSTKEDKVPQLSTVELLTDRLGSVADSLFVYSDANDPDLDLSSLFPEGDALLIVTTANELLSSLASEPHLHIKTDAMTEMEAVDMILRSANRESPSNEDRIAASAIAEKLQYLPLALAQAGSYISESGCTDVEYLALLEQQLPQSSEQQDPVSATCTINFHRIPREAQRFLQLLSILESSNFPLANIPIAAKQDFRSDTISFVERSEDVEGSVQLLAEIFFREGSWSGLAMSEMAHTLEKYAFASITLITETALVRVHPLVRNWAFTQIAVAERVVFRDAACRLVTAAMGEPRLERYLPAHIDALMGLQPLGPIHLNELAAFGKILVNRRLRQQARPLWAVVYQKLREIYGAQNLHVATAALELGGTYDEALDQMEKFETEAIVIREALLGPQHLDTLLAKGELSGTFDRQKREEESLQLKEEVLRGLKLQSSPADPNVLKEMFWLGFYRMRRKNDAGEMDCSSEFWSQVLEGNRAHYGRAHPKTLSALRMLTHARHDSYADAQRVRLECAEMLGTQLGETHITTLQYKAYLGRLHDKEKEYIQSEEFLTKLVESQRGPGYTNGALESMCMLARLYERQKRYSEAESLRLEVLAIKREIVGEDDALVIESTVALADSYYAQDRYAEAANLAETVLEKYESIYGPTRTETLLAMHKLSKTYQKQGRLADAENLQLRELKGWETQPNPMNPNVASVMGNLAHTYSLQGRHSEAEALRLKVLERNRADRGDSHPSTITSMNNLACTYTRLRRHADAANLWTIVLKAREASLGRKHQHTKNATAELLASYTEMSAVDAVSALKQHFREDSILLTHLMTALVGNYDKRNKYSEAAIVLVEYIKVCTDEGEVCAAAVGSFTLAKFYYKLGRLEEAETHAMDAARVFFRLNDPNYQEAISLLETIRQPTLSSAFKWIKRSFF